MRRRWSSVLVSLASLAAACGQSAPPAAPPVARPASAVTPQERAPAFGPAAIDAALHEEWKRANVVPAARADDATFVRRAYLDIVGTIPSADATAKFLADTAPDKRAKLVDALLATPEYAEHWMNYWDDVLMGREGKGPSVDRVAFRSWLKGRFSAHAHWDRIVVDILSATGQNGTRGPKMGKMPGLAMDSDRSSSEEDDSAINGAVNWTLRFEQNPQDIGGNASRVFLGVQIQCAQCHDHKTESWKQDDFRRFSSAFFRTRVDALDTGKPMGIRRVELLDSAVPQARFTKNAELAPLIRAKATALDGTDLEKGIGTRKAMAAWMTSKDNKWFAKAFVNRMWGHFLGRGFYDPVDDIRPSNPASAPDLLDRIAADFAAHDFDIDHLVRTICATEAYGLSVKRATTTADPENKLWASFHLVPLGPEELLNALFRATDVEAAAEKAGVKNVDALRAAVFRQYAFVFDTDEEADAPDYSGTIAQALALLNGALVTQGSRALPGSTAGDLANAPGTDADKVDALVLKVLSRHATPEERERWVAYVAGADGRASADSKPRDPAKGKGGKAGPLSRLANRRRPNVSPRAEAYEDILWSLLNSSEFSFNH